MLMLQAQEPPTKEKEGALDLEGTDLSISLRSTSYQAHGSSESKDQCDIKKNNELNVKRSSDMNNLYDNWQTFFYVGPSFLSVKQTIR